jgi:phosphohistidine phosphatase
MILYLVQHGEAVAEAEDPARPLSPRGAETARRMARWAAEARLVVDEIRHSGKRRAAQTAEVLGAALAPARGVREAGGLAPRDDVHPCAEELHAGPPRLMLVGHLPHLSRLASLLVAGDPDLPLVAFRNAGIVCLTDEPGRWVVAWVVTPELVGSERLPGG